MDIFSSVFGDDIIAENDVEYPSIMFTFDQYYAAVMQQTDVFTQQSLEDGWMEEFRALNKLKEIFHISFCECTDKEQFMPYFEEVYLSRGKEEIYKKFLSTALKVANKFYLDFGIIVKTADDIALHNTRRNRRRKGEPLNAGEFATNDDRVYPVAVQEEPSGSGSNSGQRVRQAVVFGADPGIEEKKKRSQDRSSVERREQSTSKSSAVNGRQPESNPRKRVLQDCDARRSVESTKDRSGGRVEQRQNIPQPQTEKAVLVPTNVVRNEPDRPDSRKRFRQSQTEDAPRIRESTQAPTPAAMIEQPRLYPRRRPADFPRGPSAVQGKTTQAAAVSVVKPHTVVPANVVRASTSVIDRRSASSGSGNVERGRIQKKTGVPTSGTEHPQNWRQTTPSTGQMQTPVARSFSSSLGTPEPLRKKYVAGLSDRIRQRKDPTASGRANETRIPSAGIQNEPVRANPQSRQVLERVAAVEKPKESAISVERGAREHAQTVVANHQELEYDAAVSPVDSIDAALEQVGSAADYDTDDDYRTRDFADDLADSPQPRRGVTIDVEPVVFTVGARKSTAVENYEHAPRAGEDTTRSSTTTNHLQILNDFVMDCPCPSEDVKVYVNTSALETMVVPYALTAIPRPNHIYYEHWETVDIKQDICRVLKRFSRPLHIKFRTDEEEKEDDKLSNLFIHDILLAPSKLKDDLQRTAAIDLKYPAKYSQLFEAFAELRKTNMNAYVIKNIYVAYGIDIAVRAIDADVCVDQIRRFVKKLLKEIRLEFNKKSNMRTKDDMQGYRPVYPSVCFVTIPYAKSHHRDTRNFNSTIKKINDFYKGLVLKHNDDDETADYMDLRIIDWQRQVEEKELELVEDFAARYQELYEILNTAETVFINPN